MLGKSRKGQSLASGLMGLMIVVIIGIAVALPVVQDTVSNQNLTGTTGTIANLLPLFLVLILFMAFVAYMRFK